MIDHAQREQDIIGMLNTVMMKTEDIKQVERYTNLIKESDFKSKAARVAFDYIKRAVAASESFDSFTLKDWVNEDARCQGENLGAIIMEACHRNAPSYVSIGTNIRLQREYSGRVNALNYLEQLSRQFSECEDIKQIAGQAASFFEGVAGELNTKENRSKHVTEYAREYMEQIESDLKDPEHSSGMTTGMDGLDSILGRSRMKPGTLMVIGARPGLGKAQPLNSLVLMSDGKFKRMGDMQPGDKVASVDGKESKVTGVFPQGVRPVYEVKLSDGRIVEADENHLWEINSSKFDGTRVVDTIKLQSMLERVRYKGRIHLAEHNGDFGVDENVGCHPWVIGAMLGDGCLNNHFMFSATEEYMVGKMRKHATCELRSSNGKDFRLTLGRGSLSKERKAFGELGLLNKKSHEKFLPEKFISFSKGFREQLLAGLMETDGWVEKHGVMMFSSSSERLRDGFASLVNSLGGRVSKGVKTNVFYTKNNEKHYCRDSYKLSFYLDSASRIFKSPRIQKNLPKNKRVKSPSVESVKFVRNDETQCIKVSHPKELYITDGYVVTHNTALMVYMMLAQAQAEKQKGFIAYSMEMPGLSIYERMVSNETGYSYDDVLELKEDDVFSMVTQATTNLVKTSLYINDTSQMGINDIENNAREMAKERPIGALYVDYLTIMEMPKKDRHDLSVGEITRRLKRLSVELNCCVILLAQLNRSIDDPSRKDKRAIAKDLRDSGSVEQDADYILFPYRDIVYNERSEAREYCELILRKNRHGKTGTAYARFVNGRFIDCDQEQGQTRCQVAENEKDKPYEPYKKPEKGLM